MQYHQAFFLQTLKQAATTPTEKHRKAALNQALANLLAPTPPK